MYSKMRADKRVSTHTHIYAVLSCVQLSVAPWTVAHQAPLSMGPSRQEYCSGLPCPPPGDLPNPGIGPAYSVSPALAGGFFTTEPAGKPEALGPLIIQMHTTSVKDGVPLWPCDGDSALPMRGAQV